MQTATYLNPFTDFGFKELFAAAEIAKLIPEEALGDQW